MVLAYFIFRSNKRKSSITIKAISDVLSAIHFFLLGQWTGCVINGVNTIRGICFCQRGHYKWASGIWIPVVFCGATVVGSAMSWTGPESILAMIGTCLGVIGYWCKEPKNLRRFNFVGVSLWIIYGAIVLSVPTIVSNLIAFTSIVLTEIGLKNKEEHYGAV